MCSSTVEAMLRPAEYNKIKHLFRGKIVRSLMQPSFARWLVALAWCPRGIVSPALHKHVTARVGGVIFD